MGEEHGEVQPTPRCDCDEPSAAAGSQYCGRPPRADERNAAGSGADFHGRFPHSGDETLERKTIPLPGDIEPLRFESLYRRFVPEQTIGVVEVHEEDPRSE